MTENKLRILFLLTQDLESPLGIGRIWPLAKELAKNGHQVRIVALHSRWSALTERKFWKDGVAIEYVGQMHVRKVGNQKLYYSTSGLIRVVLLAIWALSRAALSESVDIIQVCKPQPMNSIAGLLARSIRGGVLCVDCDDYEAATNRFTAEWQRKVVAFFERKVPCFAQVVTTHTQFMWDKLIDWGCEPKRIHYLPNGVDLERFKTPLPATIETLRKKLALEGRSVVAFLGTLSLANHPVDLLLKAFTILRKHNPTAVLMLVGGGDDFLRLKTMAHQSGIAQDVLFTGRVAPAEVPDYYALANVSVDPVYDDDAARGRLPLKMFESWAMGVPFVTSPVGDRQRLAGDPPASLMARPAGDLQALALTIQSVLTLAELADSLRKRGFERVKDFSWDLLARELEAVYLAALSNSNE